MNIFFLDKDPVTCVQSMNDSHVSKMILESAQILSSVVHHSGVERGDRRVYTPTHMNHPCVRWAGDSLSNWKALKHLALCMDDEFEFRFGGRHRSAEVIRQLPVPTLKDVGFTVPARALPETLRRKLGPALSLDDVVFSYRIFYNLHKRHLAKWSRRPAPYWWERSAVRAQLFRRSQSTNPFRLFMAESS